MRRTAILVALAATFLTGCVSSPARLDRNSFRPNIPAMPASVRNCLPADVKIPATVQTVGQAKALIADLYRDSRISRRCYKLAVDYGERVRREYSN